MLQSKESQIVRHNWTTEQQQHCSGLELWMKFSPSIVIPESLSGWRLCLQPWIEPENSNKYLHALTFLNLSGDVQHYLRWMLIFLQSKQFSWLWMCIQEMEMIISSSELLLWKIITFHAAMGTVHNYRFACQGNVIGKSIAYSVAQSFLTLYNPMN